MEDRLKRHIDALFENAPPTRRALELKEELLQNLLEKYEDLHKECGAEEAYRIAIAGIGDVRELFHGLEEKTVMDTNAHEKARQKSALFTAIAVMLYILSPVAAIIVSRWSEDGGGISVIVISAIATGLLVYNGMTKPKYIRRDETMVEEFKEWKSEKDSRKSLRRSISSALWSITTALYFIVSFMTGAWHISWVAFIIAGALESLINILFILRK